MVLTAGEDAGLVGVPAVNVIGAPGVFEGLFHAGPDGAQPFVIAADLPVAIGLHYAAELAVAAGAEGRGVGAEGELDAEGHGTVFEEVVAVVGGAHGALEGGE